MSVSVATFSCTDLYLGTLLSELKDYLARLDVYVNKLDMLKKNG